MNGSTNGTSFGYSSRNITEFLNIIKNEYLVRIQDQEEIYNKICSSIRGEAVTAMGLSEGTYGMGITYSAVTNGWYAPEAQEFCNNVLRPKAEESFRKANQGYKEIFEAVRLAAMKWSQATGNLATYPAWDVDYRKPNVNYAVLAQKNGVAGIDPMLGTTINDISRACSQVYYRGSQIFDYMKSNNSLFIGAEQAQALNKKIQNILNQLQENSNTVCVEVKRQIDASIEKYQALAKQIAANFNSGVVESATASVNNGQ